MFDYNKIIRFFLYAGCKDEEEYRCIFPEIQRINRDILKIVTATLTFLLLVLILVSNCFYFYYNFSINYIFIFTFSALFTFLIWSLPAKNIHYTQSLLYVFVSLAYFFGILNGIMVPNMTSVGFIVTLITLPLLFIDRPIRLLFISMTAMAVFSLAIVISKPYIIIMYDLTNVVIYGFFGIIISNYIVYVKVSKLLADKKLRIMSETDLLTGLRNRNSYEQNLPLYPLRCKFSLTLIYIDANGLHELNNTRGHKAGDEMLCAIADLLKSRFYPSDSYRIGGDEFVVFVADDINNNVPTIMVDISDLLEKKDYHISFGITTVPASKIDMNALIIETEQKMYKAKSLYYQLKGIDRRRKRNINVKNEV